MGQDTGEEVRELSRREGHAAVGEEVDAPSCIYAGWTRARVCVGGRCSSRGGDSGTLREKQVSGFNRGLTSELSGNGAEGGAW